MFLTSFMFLISSASGVLEAGDRLTELRIVDAVHDGEIERAWDHLLERGLRWTT